MTNSAPDTDLDLRALIAAARAGERSALEAVLDRIYPRLHGLVRQKLWSEFRSQLYWMLIAFSPADVAQEVLLRIGMGFELIEGEDEGALVQYLATSVHRRLIDMVRFHSAARRDQRRRSTEELPELTTNDPQPLHQAVLGEQMQAIDTALAGFPFRQRQLLRLRLEEGLPFDAIADRLGFAGANSARKTFYTVRARLRVRLTSLGFE